MADQPAAQADADETGLARTPMTVYGVNLLAAALAPLGFGWGGAGGLRGGQGHAHRPHGPVAPHPEHR